MSTTNEIRKGSEATHRSGACLRAAVQSMLIYGANLEVFNLTDIERMGYAETTGRRAIKALLDWGAVREAAPHAYLISPEMKARFLKEVAMSRARARVVLFEAFGMAAWDEKKMDSFLSDFKEFWRRRASETAPDRVAVSTSSPPPAGC